MNKSVFKIKEITRNSNSIDGTSNNGKMADKISEKFLFKGLYVASYVIYDEWSRLE